MRSKNFAALFLAAGLCPALTAAQAGPCTARIKQFEKTMRETSSDPGIGPGLPQSIGAQISHQPTPQSVNRAEERAQAGFEAVLARAKKLDREGKRAACMEALTDAKLIYFQ